MGWRRTRSVSVSVSTRSHSIRLLSPLLYKSYLATSLVVVFVFCATQLSERSFKPKPLASQELASRQDQQPQLLLLHQREEEEEEEEEDHHHHQQQDEEELESDQQRNQWLVVRLYEAINGRDHAAAHDLLAPDLEWWYHGPPASHHMMRLLTGCSGGASSSFRFRPLSVHALPASDVVIAEGVTGRDDDSYWVHAWTVGPGPHGVITHLREYLNTDLTVTRLPPTRCLWHSRRPDLPPLLLAL